MQHCSLNANSPREINDNAAPRYEKQLEQFGFDDNLCQPYGLHFFARQQLKQKTKTNLIHIYQASDSNGLQFAYLPASALKTLYES